MCSNPRSRKARSEPGLLVLLIVCGSLLATNGALAQSSPAHYGRVTLDSYSSRAGLGPVAFDHWLHRAKFTCRVCHVDIGFGMQAKSTGITASTNRAGYHCGVCHNGKTLVAGQPVFAACSDFASGKQCARCHSADNAARTHNYDAFTARLPKGAYGVDWEEAESSGLIKPIDFIEGASIRKPALKSQEDLPLKARVKWVSDIIFSHKKHTAWNGCELCHPEIFPATQKGVVRYSMFQISGSQYCGACHGKVAFPVNACSGCHKNMKDKTSLRNVVVLPGPEKAAGFGSVKFMHKTHVGDRNAKCEACHHPSKPQKPRTEAEQGCSNCHTRNPMSPMKTPLRAAFHNSGATAGICIGCHKDENAKNLNNDVEFIRTIMPRQQATIDTAKAQLVYGRDAEMRQLAQEIIREQQSNIEQMELWLKEHDSTSWAPVKCRDCHKKMNNPQ